MSKKEDLETNMALWAILSNHPVTVINKQRFGSEANLIRLAHTFDLIFVFNASMVNPSPHHIATVYDAMPLGQPVSFLMEDESGPDRTIMPGLQITSI
ncbi:hypothetical protein [Methanosarcina mazei]|uniref:Uncharacterized protein n=1 Tax=Methanosarcina mazei TaxID=2209 RepID=A0A0F8IUG9_METMZ|nr:hypothetical protein [Methanosarcina mazei]KKG83064.1 hypothetical protein DU55_08170 [Methanosarcina mazei]